MMKGEKSFHYIALVIMTLFMLFCIVPLVLMCVVSFSSENSLLIARAPRLEPGASSLITHCS